MDLVPCSICDLYNYSSNNFQRLWHVCVQLAHIISCIDSLRLKVNNAYKWCTAICYWVWWLQYKYRSLIIITIHPMFTVLSLWYCHCECSPGLSDKCSSWPLYQANQLESTDLTIGSHGDYIHHNHLLLLLSLTADTHITIPRKAESWVDLEGWLVTHQDEDGILIQSKY